MNSPFNKLKEVLCNSLCYSFISNLTHGKANSGSAKEVLVELIQYPNALLLNFVLLIQRKCVVCIKTKVIVFFI